MDNEFRYPILIYDNLCSSCTTYARIIDIITRGRITILGHYTKNGERVKLKTFPSGYNGLEMSWLITHDKAYGGRKALEQIIKHIFSIKHGDYQENNFNINECTEECRTLKNIIVRTSSVLTKGKIIKR